MPRISRPQSQHTRTGWPTDWLVAGPLLSSLYFWRFQIRTDLFRHILDKCVSWLVRPDKNLIQSRIPKEGMGKVDTRTLAIRKKKWRVGMFDLRRPELAPFRVSWLNLPTTNKVKDRNLEFNTFIGAAFVLPTYLNLEILSLLLYLYFKLRTHISENYANVF